MSWEPWMGGMLEQGKVKKKKKHVCSKYVGAN